MFLSVRLRWKKWRLREQPVRAEGRPLSDMEEYWLAVAEFALADEEGTRRVAVNGKAAAMHATEMLTAGEKGSDWC